MAAFKTNAMRMVERAKIPYGHIEYDESVTEGTQVAKLMGQDEKAVFKTLVTETPKREHYVFVIPVAETLDLKKAAKAVGEKSVSMIKQKELLPLTGYIHGGCSPVGMKKQFTTVFHSTVLDYDKIFVSAGHVGHQMCIEPSALISLVGGATADLTVQQ